MNDLALLILARRAAQSGMARALRIEAGLSQAEVGAVCGLTHAAISRYERGQRAPRGQAGVKYGELLDQLRSLE